MATKIIFVKDDSSEDIEIIIKAKEQTEEVGKILRILGQETAMPCNLLSENSMIDVQDILLISKSGRYTSIRTTHGDYILNEPLYKIEERLDKTWFVRISQSEIVNLRYVKKWSFEGGGIIRIELSNGLTSYTSRRCAIKIREILRGGKKE